MKYKNCNSKHYKSLKDVPVMTQKEKEEIIKKVEEGVKRNSKLKNKGFDQEEVDGMTEEELKEYGIKR